MLSKLIPTGIVLGLSVFMIFNVINNSRPQDPDPTPIPASAVNSTNIQDIYYWGTTCPYCHDVIDWMEEVDLASKVSFVKKEVYENQANSSDLRVKAASCGFDIGSIGVPFLYTKDGNCLVGKDDIIAYFTTQLEGGSQ
jgi:glutaredoxin